MQLFAGKRRYGIRAIGIIALCAVGVHSCNVAMYNAWQTALLTNPLAQLAPSTIFTPLNVSLGVANPAGALAFTILNAGHALDVELSALQENGRGEIVSNPRVITSNQREALIRQGQEIGYVTTTGIGAAATQTVAFKEALLELKVTPTITQDGRVYLNIAIKKDDVSSVFQTQQ